MLVVVAAIAGLKKAEETAIAAPSEAGLRF